MNPVEIMTSESQERMLAIVRPEHLPEVLGLCDRWEIRAAVIGRVTDTGRFRVYDHAFDEPGGALLADVPIGSLGDGPVYERPLAPPADRAERAADDPAPVLAARFVDGTDLGPELLALLASPTIADKTWVSRQYDHQLFLNTVVGPGGDATVLRLKGTGRGLALSTDGKARFCALDPFVGAQLAVLEAARNLACVGATPRALVNCLNFGNPEHPEVMWQFSQVVDGMNAACEALELPVVGGNVSFYNESRGRDIDPTPVVGLVGIVEPLELAPPGPVLVPGAHLLLLGVSGPEVGGSEWATQHGLTGGLPPVADLAGAVALHELVRGIVSERLVRGVHDCSDGGVAVALAEMAIAGGCGFDVALALDTSVGIAAFSESASACRGGGRRRAGRRGGAAGARRRCAVHRARRRRG